MTMYRLILYNVIYVVAFWMTLINCLKGQKKGKGENKKILKTTPIAYETDPVVLEKERRQKIAENREKMRKKRRKPVRTFEEIQEAQLTKKKIKEKEMLSEDSTQSMHSDKSLEKGSKEKASKSDESEEKTITNQNTKKEKKEKKSVDSSEEEIGEVQLVDEESYAAAKKHIIKKRAHELARKRQTEDAIRKRQELENVNANVVSPDDTLKNISSIQMESQLSIIQRKRREQRRKDGCDEDGTLVEPKSNELYIRDMPERIME